MQMTTTHQARKPGAYIFELFMILLSMIVVIPLLLLLLNSVKNPVESSVLTLRLPTEWVFGNYAVVVQKSHVIRSLFNSLFISGVSVVLNIFCSALASYCICRRTTKLNNFFYRLFFLGLIAPVSIIPIIRLMQTLHMMNTYTSLILIYTSINLPFSVFMFTGFIKASVPSEMDEAGIIDGCSGLSVFIRIILPLLKPVIFTCIILTFMNVWNDFQFPLYFLNSTAKWTMPLTIYNFSGEFTSEWNLMCADMVFMILPIMILFIFSQKYIVSGMVAGAIKG